jgi:hypothetical protein
MAPGEKPRDGDGDDPLNPAGTATWHEVGGFWLLGNRGTEANGERDACLVLRPRAERSSVSGLTLAERRELGGLLGPLASAVTELTGDGCVTVAYADDSADPRVYVELSARHGARAAPLGAADPAALARTATAQLTREQRGSRDATHYAFVDAVVGVIAALQRLSLYNLALRAWARKENTNRRRAQVAPAYVLGWLAADTALLFSSPAWVSSSSASAVCAAIAAYRFLDIVLFQIRIMLSRGPEQTVLAAFDRSLIMLAINVVELTLISGVWLRASGIGSTTGAWFSGFMLTTFVGTPEKPSPLTSTMGTEIDLTTVATVSGALVLLVGGLGLLIGLIGQKFREYEG